MSEYRKIVEKIFFNFLMGQYNTGEKIYFSNDCGNSRVENSPNVNSLEELVSHGVDVLQKGIFDIKKYFTDSVQFIRDNNVKCKDSDELLSIIICSCCNCVVIFGKYYKDRFYENSKRGYCKKCFDNLYQNKNYRKSLTERYIISEICEQKRINEKLIEGFNIKRVTNGEDYDDDDIDDLLEIHREYLTTMAYTLMSDILPTRCAFGGDSDTGYFEDFLEAFIIQEIEKDTI